MDDKVYLLKNLIRKGTDKDCCSIYTYRSEDLSGKNTFQAWSLEECEDNINILNSKLIGVARVTGYDL